MESQSNMETRLWDYIDGACNSAERSFIEQLIAGNQEWRAKYKELLEVHQLMAGIELDEPSMRFTRNVMEEIGKHHIAPAANTYINKRVIWGIGAFFILSIVGFLIYGFGQVYLSETSSSPIDFGGFDWERLNFGRFFNNTYATVFMMINVVLGLVLLDMYLGKKKKNIEQGTRNIEP